MEAAFARVLAIAASTGLEGIESAPSYGTPGLKVHGKFLARMKDDETLVVRCPLEEKGRIRQAWVMQAARRLVQERKDVLF